MRVSRGRPNAPRLLNKVCWARDDLTESRWSVVVDEWDPPREWVGVGRFFWETIDAIESRWAVDVDIDKSEPARAWAAAGCGVGVTAAFTFSLRSLALRRTSIDGSWNLLPRVLPAFLVVTSSTVSASRSGLAGGVYLLSDGAGDSHVRTQVLAAQA